MMIADSLELAAKVARSLQGYVSERRVFDVLKRITLYNRIQASPGLVEAVGDIERFIIDEAPDIVEVRSFKYTGKAGPEWLSLPAHWEVHDGWIEAAGKRYTLNQHPTLVAAHSPGSDGIIEGKVAELEDPLNPDSYKSRSDAILLIKKHHKLAYRLAAEAGIPAVILADPSKDHDSFPYMGLFLSQDEAQKYQTVAVTLPWKLAEPLPGKTVRIRVDADLGGPGQLPVLAAWIGDKDSKGPVVLAHICHPRPGANDNASGSAAAVEAFLSLAEAIDEGLLEPPGETIRLVLLPEYTGSFLSMEGWLSQLLTHALNLDMVGRRDPYSGEPRLLYSPVAHGVSRIGDIFYDVGLAIGANASIDYYMAGSDHDVALAYERDAVMYNQWPDRFYHTDSDDADTISTERLHRTALLAAATLYLATTEYKPTDTSRKNLVRKIIARHVARGDYDTARLASAIMTLKYDVEAPSQGLVQWKPVDDDRWVKPKIPLYAGILVQLESLEARLKLTSEIEGLGFKSNTLNILNEVFFSARGGSTVRRLHTELASAYGINLVSGDRLRNLLTSLEDAGLIELTG